LTLFLKVTLRPTGIVALRALPQSKMRTPLRYVPPTTLVGAIAYPLYHLSKSRTETIYERNTFKSTANSIVNLFEWVTVKNSKKPKLYGALLKINTVYRGNVQSAITSFPFTVLYGSSDFTIIAAYLINENELSRSTFTMRDFERAAWGITRLGSRESIVSVENVERGKAEIVESSSAVTSYAFPFEGFEVQGRGTLQSVVDWRSGIGDYSGAKRMVLFYPEENVRVTGPLRTITIGGETIVLAP